MKGLEPSRPEALEPKSSASANSATSASAYILYHKMKAFHTTIFKYLNIHYHQVNLYLHEVGDV